MEVEKLIQTEKCNCEKVGMEWTDSRLYTENLLRLVEMEYIDASWLLKTVLRWISEDTVKKIATDTSLCDSTSLLPDLSDSGYVDYWLEYNGKIGG